MRFGPGDGGHVVQHVVERDVGGVRKPEHHHAERIADQQDVHATFVEQARGRVIVGGERGDRASAFAVAQGLGFLKGGHGERCGMDGGMKPKSPRLGRRL